MGQIALVSPRGTHSSDNRIDPRCSRVQFVDSENRALSDKMTVRARVFASVSIKLNFQVLLNYFCINVLPVLKTSTCQLGSVKSLNLNLAARLQHF